MQIECVIMFINTLTWNETWKMFQSRFALAFVECAHKYQQENVTKAAKKTAQQQQQNNERTSKE